MASTIELHLDPCTTNSRKVLACLDLLAVPYTLRKLDYFAGAHKTPDFLALNPSGTVPCAIIDATLVLTESNAIIAYAAEQTPTPNNNAAFPGGTQNAKKRAEILKWLFWEASSWSPSCAIYLRENIINPTRDEAKGPDTSALRREEARWRDLAGILEHTLLGGGGGRKWLCGGEEATVADVAVASAMGLWKRAGFPVEGFPGLRRWVARVEGLGCWVRTQGDVERAFPLGVGVGREGVVGGWEGEV